MAAHASFHVVFLTVTNPREYVCQSPATRADLSVGERQVHLRNLHVHVHVHVQQEVRLEQPCKDCPSWDEPKRGPRQRFSSGRNSRFLEEYDQCWCHCSGTS